MSPPLIQIGSTLEAVNAAVEIWWEDGAQTILKDPDPLYKIEDVTGDMKPDRGKVKLAKISKDVAFGDYQMDDSLNDPQPLAKGMADVFSPTIHSYEFGIGEEFFYVDIPVLAVEDDAWGVYEEYTKNVADEVAKRRRILTGYKVTAASTALCYTGLSYYNAAQKVDPTNSSLGTYQNLWDLPLTKPNFELLYGKMQTFPDESGRPAGNRANILMVSPEQQSLAEEIVKAMRGQFGADNVNTGKVELRVNPMWTGANSKIWDLYCTFGAKKPLGYAQIMAPTPKYLGEMTIDSKRVHRWQARVRDRIVYVDPAKAVRSVPPP